MTYDEIKDWVHNLSDVELEDLYKAFETEVSERRMYKMDGTDGLRLVQRIGDSAEYVRS